MTSKKIAFAVPNKASAESWVMGDARELSLLQSQVSLATETQKTVNTEDSVKDMEKVKMKRLTIDLDNDTHKRFKMKAMSYDKTMVDLVRDWISDFVHQD